MVTGAVLILRSDLGDQQNPLQTEQLKRVELPAVTLEVVENPSLAVGSPMSRTSQPQPTVNLWRWIGGLVVVTCIAVWLFRHFYRSFAMRLSAWRSRRAEREVAYFARLKTACQSGDTAMAYDALTHWIHRMYGGEGVPTIEQFVHDTEDAELRDQKEQLERQLFAAPATPHTAWSGQVFYQRLAAVRKRMHQRTTRYNRQAQYALPPLNPSVDEPVGEIL